MKTKIIFETNSVFSELDTYLKNYKKTLLITDVKIYNHYKTEINNLNIFTYTIASGEISKSINNVTNIINFLSQHTFPRKGSCLVAFGGGIVGDLTGFIASIYMRGISYIQIPTSLLAMVDSSIGGKTAINTKWGKNLIGSFYFPEYVFISIDLLKTLPNIELINGMAEVIKIAITSDKKLFDYLLNHNLKTVDFELIIKKAVQLKETIVEKDIKEKEITNLTDSRELLNFGHSIGHAIEKTYGLKHGFAVAIGIIAESILICDSKSITQIKKCLQNYGLPTHLYNDNNNNEINLKEIIKYYKRDKKDGRIVSIKSITNPIYCKMDYYDIISVINPIRKIKYPCMNIKIPINILNCTSIPILKSNNLIKSTENIILYYFDIILSILTNKVIKIPKEKNIDFLEQNDCIISILKKLGYDIELNNLTNKLYFKTNHCHISSLVVLDSIDSEYIILTCLISLYRKSSTKIYYTQKHTLIIDFINSIQKLGFDIKIKDDYIFINQIYNHNKLNCDIVINTQSNLTLILIFILLSSKLPHIIINDNHLIQKQKLPILENMVRIGFNFRPYIVKKDVLYKNHNIILIGLPGSGKTFLSKAYARHKKIKIYDTDELIENKIEISIKDYIINYGFRKFREIEIEVFTDLIQKTIDQKKEPCIISTGGGIVENSDFYRIIPKDYDIIYIKRDNIHINESFYNMNLEQLSLIRNPLYQTFSDAIYLNNTNTGEDFCQWLENIRI